MRPMRLPAPIHILTTIRDPPASDGTTAKVAEIGPKTLATLAGATPLIRPPGTTSVTSKIRNCEPTSIWSAPGVNWRGLRRPRLSIRS